MIPVNELRIGNWVDVKERKEWDIKSRFIRVVEIVNGGINLFEDSFDYSEKSLIGIPITEEILIKCGFKDVYWANNKGVAAYYEHTTDDCVVFYFNEDGEQIDCTALDSSHKGKCQSLHQLQNLFFALTGKELEIKF